MRGGKDNMKDKIYTEIKEYAREIKMPKVLSCFEDEIREAKSYK